MDSEVTTLIADTTTIYKIKRVMYFVSKRIFDIIVSLIGLLVLIPTTIIVKIIYLLSGDFKTIFFVQERIGKNGKIFKFFKFRSMVPNADEILFKALANITKIKN